MLSQIIDFLLGKATTRRTSQHQSTPAPHTATSITSTTCTSSDTCPPSAASVCPRFVKECYLSAEEKGAIASNNCSEFVISSVCMCVWGGMVLSHYHSFQNYFFSENNFPSVRPFDRPSVRPTVRPSDRPKFFELLKHFKIKFR